MDKTDSLRNNKEATETRTNSKYFSI